MDLDIVIMGHKKIYNNCSKEDELYIYNIDENKIYSGKTISDMMLQRKIQGYSCDKLIRLDLIKKSNMYFEPNRYIEDLYPIFKIAYESNKISFVNKAMYNYRQLESSISHKINEKIINDYAYANYKVLDYAKKKKQFKKDNIICFRYEAFRTIITMLNEKNNKSYNIYKEFKEQGYKGIMPTPKEILKCKLIKLTSKIDIILWKFRVYNICMPELIKLKKYIEKYMI